MEKAAIACGTKYFAVRDRAEMHRAAGPSREQIERALAVGDRGFDALGERQHLPAGLRQQHAVAGPLHQRQAGEVLKLPELLGHGGLGQAELARGRGDAAPADSAASERNCRIVRCRSWVAAWPGPL